MAEREQLIRDLAAMARESHWAATFALGWCVRDTPSEALEGLVEALRESPTIPSTPNHWAAYQERWAPVKRG